MINVFAMISYVSLNTPTHIDIKLLIKFTCCHFEVFLTDNSQDVGLISGIKIACADESMHNGTGWHYTYFAFTLKYVVAEFRQKSHWPVWVKAGGVWWIEIQRPQGFLQVSNVVRFFSEFLSNLLISLRWFVYHNSSKRTILYEYQVGS